MHLNYEYTVRHIRTKHDEINDRRSPGLFRTSASRAGNVSNVWVTGSPQLMFLFLFFANSVLNTNISYCKAPCETHTRYNRLFTYDVSYRRGDGLEFSEFL